MPLDAGLKLLVSIVRQPYRTIGKEYRGQRHIKRHWGMIAAAKTTAHIGERVWMCAGLKGARAPPSI